MTSLLTVARHDGVGAGELAAAARSVGRDAPSDGALRREVFCFRDLAIHVREFDGAAPTGPDPLFAVVAPGGELPRPSAYYEWRAPGFTGGHGLFTSVIVNRMDPGHREEVRRLFADLDATDFPIRMGTRRRRVLASGDLYLHTQDFPRPDAAEVIDHAWQASDPRFVRICEALMKIVPPYDPTSWTVPADSLAECVYATDSTSVPSLGTR